MNFLIKFHSVSVIADEDGVQVYEIEMTYVEKLLENEPGLAMRFYCRLAQRLAEALLTTNPNQNKAIPNVPIAQDSQSKLSIEVNFYTIS